MRVRLTPGERAAHERMVRKRMMLADVEQPERLVVPEHPGRSDGDGQAGGAEDSARYPALTETVETTTSTLFFVSDRVYKLRKAIHLGYADLRSREAREAACRAEIGRNRPLAPDVYLGIADVRDAAGTPLDHMIAMRRLPADCRLSDLVARGEPLDGPLRAVAKMLAAFHERCDTSVEISAHGRLPALEQSWLAALEGLASSRDTLLDAEVVDEIGRLAMGFLHGRRELFDGRARAGQVRDGHGDVTADHVFCLDDGPRILHRIEFDERLRVGDVLADVAVLALDLERLGAPDAAARFLAWYREFSGESHPPALEHFYLAFRAVVRAGQSCAPDQPWDAEETATARRLTEIALDHLRRARVRLVLVGGAPGRRRAAVAERLSAAADGWVLLGSDAVRGELAIDRERAGGPEDAGLQDVGSEDAAPGSVDPGEAGLFGSDDDVHAEQLRRAGQALSRGESVVLEARLSRAGYRTGAVRVAERTGADLVELRCAADSAWAWPTAIDLPNGRSLDDAVREARGAVGPGA